MDKKKKGHIPLKNGDLKERGVVSEEQITESIFYPSGQLPCPYTNTEIGTPDSVSEKVTNSFLYD